MTTLNPEAENIRKAIICHGTIDRFGFREYEKSDLVVLNATTFRGEVLNISLFRPKEADREAFSLEVLQTAAKLLGVGVKTPSGKSHLLAVIRGIPQVKSCEVAHDGVFEDTKPGRISGHIEVSLFGGVRNFFHFDNLVEEAFSTEEEALESAHKWVKGQIGSEELV